MLSKKKRVTKELFQDIMMNGRVISGPLFVFRYIPSLLPSYAVVAPKSVAKQAVDRNKLRRRGYNALRDQSLPLCAGIFFYKKQAKGATINEIKESIEIILKKLKNA